MQRHASEWIADGHRRARGRSRRCPARPRAQEDCPRGTLDKAYCDRNGDLTADLPTDPKKIVNPSTLIFSYTPVEDPAVYQKVWDGFHQEPGEDHRQEGGVLPGAVERRAIRGDALGPPAHRRRQRRRQCARGELRGLRAVRDDGGAGQQLRLRDGNHRAGRQPDQGRRPISRATRSRSPTRPRTPASRRRRRSSRPTSISRPSATSSRCSPASTTTRSSASSTRTTRRRRWPTRCSTG